MSKSIGLFIDGTWNTVTGSSDTNVRKLFELASRVKSVDQPCCYVPGVGKDLSAGETSVDDTSDAWLADFHEQYPRPRSSWLTGGAGGAGTAYRIQEAYAFLCHHYQQRRGDKVYVFGFSRGAFAARSLVGFASKVGILLQDHIELLPEAYSLYEHSEDATQSALKTFIQELTGRDLIPAHQDDSAALKVHFLGLWDLVGALGLPRRLRVFSAPFTEYHEVEIPPNIMRARHAMALHEFREDFPLTTWSRARAGDDFEQMWFPGAHADVGGGYALHECGLSDNALVWMADEARKAGLMLPSSLPLGHEKVFHQQWLWHLVGKPRVRQYLIDCAQHPSTGRLLDNPSVHSSVGGPDGNFRWRYAGRLTAKIQPCVEQVHELLWRAHGRKLVPASLPDLADIGDSFWRAGSVLAPGWWQQTSPADLPAANAVVEAFRKDSRVSSLQHQEDVMRALIMSAVFGSHDYLQSLLLEQERNLFGLATQPFLAEEPARFMQEHAITVAQAIRNCIRCGAPGDPQELEDKARAVIDLSRKVYLERLRAGRPPLPPPPLTPTPTPTPTPSASVIVEQLASPLMASNSRDSLKPVLDPKDHHLAIHTIAVGTLYVLSLVASLTVLTRPEAQKDLVTLLSTGAIIATFGSAICSLGTMWEGDLVERIQLNVDILFRDLFHQSNPWRRWPFLPRAAKRRLNNGHATILRLTNPQVPLDVGGREIVVSVPTVKEDFFDLPVFRNVFLLFRFRRHASTAHWSREDKGHKNSIGLSRSDEHMAYECLYDIWRSVMRFRAARYAIHLGASLTVTATLLTGYYIATRAT